MLLTFDVGNTETTLGLFDGKTLRAHWRLLTDSPRSSDELGMVLRNLITAVDVPLRDVTGVAIASVVRGMASHLSEACRAWLPVTRLENFDADSPLPITLQVDEPSTVGADRIINTLVASRTYQRDAVVVDLGTATTFDCITREGVFLGGVIAPGVRTAAETLFRRTSKLPMPELSPPAKAIGTNTEDCIKAGVVLGNAELVDGIVRRILGEWPHSDRPIIIATGGLAELFAPVCTTFDEVDPHLTLKGLAMAFDLVG
jgi:type III pantothenate kinase